MVLVVQMKIYWYVISVTLYLSTFVLSFIICSKQSFILKKSQISFLDKIFNNLFLNIFIMDALLTQQFIFWKSSYKKCKSCLLVLPIFLCVINTSTLVLNHNYNLSNLFTKNLFFVFNVYYFFREKGFEIY